MKIGEGESKVGVVIGRRVLLKMGVRETEGVMGLRCTVLVIVVSRVIGVATANRLMGVVMDDETDVDAVVLAVNGVVMAAVIAVIDDVGVRATFTGMGRITCTHLYINR